MSDLLRSVVTLAILCLGAALGRAMLRFLPTHHRSPETIAFTQTVSSLLITFTALVLGLLLSSINADFKKTDTDLHAFAASIIRLNVDLTGVGAPARPVRALVRQYAAAAIASTWPEETPPSGTYPVAVPDGHAFDAPDLGALLTDAGAVLRGLAAQGADSLLLTTCLARLDTLVDQRWTLVNEAHSMLSPAFFVMMLFWLFVVFFSFGLAAPANATAATFVVLVALSVAAAVFVILELDGPLDGLIKVSSEPLRHALAHLDAAGQTP